MTIDTKTWTCAGCGQEFVATAALPPPGWQWRGSRLLCDDCSGPEPKRVSRPRPVPSGAEASALPAASERIAA